MTGCVRILLHITACTEFVDYQFHHPVISAFWRYLGRTLTRKAGSLCCQNELHMFPAAASGRLKSPANLTAFQYGMLFVTFRGERNHASFNETSGPCNLEGGEVRWGYGMTPVRIQQNSNTVKYLIGWSRSMQSCTHNDDTASVLGYRELRPEPALFLS